MAPDRMTFALELMGLMTFAVCVIAICATIIARAAFAKTDKGGGKTLSMIFQRAGAVQLLTVQTIVMSILILRIVDAISADATISALTGIGGYVLGNFGRRDKGEKEESETSHSN